MKLFPLQEQAMVKNGNRRPGIVIDSSITSSYFQDFYLESHNGLKRTAYGVLLLHRERNRPVGNCDAKIC
jgi:hypothetical protein